MTWLFSAGSAPYAAGDFNEAFEPVIDTRARERRISHIRKLAQTHFGVVPPQLRHFGERHGQALESDGSFYFSIASTCTIAASTVRLKLAFSKLTRLLTWLTISLCILIPISSSVEFIAPTRVKNSSIFSLTLK